MRQFKIYANPQGTYEAVKKGWSWPAFFFWFIWALVKKMWALGFVVPVGLFSLASIGGAIGGNIEQVIEGLVNTGTLVLFFVFGINGNKWREANLTSRGFDLKDTVEAANGEGAIALYVKTSSENQNS